jgi:hypothetical protein
LFLVVSTFINVNKVFASIMHRKKKTFFSLSIDTTQHPLPEYSFSPVILSYFNFCLILNVLTFYYWLNLAKLWLVFFNDNAYATKFFTIIKHYISITTLQQKDAHLTKVWTLNPSTLINDCLLNKRYYKILIWFLLHCNLLSTS